MIVKKVSRRKKTTATRKQLPPKKKTASKAKVTPKKKIAATPKKKVQSPTFPSSTTSLPKRIKLIIPPGRILTAEGWNRHD